MVQIEIVLSKWFTMALSMKLPLGNHFGWANSLQFDIEDNEWHG